MEFGLCDGGEDGEYHAGVGFVKIFHMFAMQDGFFYGSAPVDTVYMHTH